MSIGKAVVFGLALSILVSACSGNDLDVTAPRVSRVDVTPSETSADVVVRTDELSRVSVEYGETTAYEGGSVDSTMLATAHTLTLFRLVEDTRYHYRITLEDRSGNRATGADSTFRTLGTVGTGGTGGMGTGGRAAAHPHAAARQRRRARAPAARAARAGALIRARSARTTFATASWTPCRGKWSTRWEMAPWSCSGPGHLTRTF